MSGSLKVLFFASILFTSIFGTQLTFAVIASGPLGPPMGATPTNNSSSRSDIVLSPLKQFKEGISVYDIKCNQGYVLVIKESNNSPACVKPQTAQKLVARGWGTLALVLQPNYSTSQQSLQMPNTTIYNGSNQQYNNFPRGTIKLDNVTLDVQIADTPERAQRGLQFQQQLPYNQGMLFVFKEPQVVSMWMKDMQFPLDMIWFDAKGNVLHIEKNIPPCNSTDAMGCLIYNGSGKNSQYVLEVTAGFVDKFNMTDSSKLEIVN